MRVVVASDLLAAWWRLGEKVPLEEVVARLREAGVRVSVDHWGVHVPVVYDPQADLHRLAGPGEKPGTWFLVAKVPREEQKLFRVVLAPDRTTLKAGQVLPVEEVVSRLTSFPGGKAEVREDGVYAPLTPAGEVPFLPSEWREATWTKVAEPYSEPKEEKREAPRETEAFPLEELPRLLEEARERGDLGVVARIAWAYRQAPLPVQERVRGVLEEFALLDQEGEGPLDGVYPLAWKRGGGA